MPGIVAAIRAVEPALDVATIAGAVTGAGAPSRLRQVAAALEADPSLLTSGAPVGPPALGRMLLALHAAGATGVVAQRCATCSRAMRLVTANGQGLRLCATCRDKALSVPAACVRCSRVRRVSARDAHGGPLCARCARAEAEVDHVAAIVEHLLAVRVGLTAQRLTGLVAEAVPQNHLRRQLRGELDADLTLLTGHPADGSRPLLALLRALHTEGAQGLAPIVCPLCSGPGPLDGLLEGRRCCATCYRRARHEQCSRCGVVRHVAARAEDGGAVCGPCVTSDPANQDTCPGCGRTAYLMRPSGGGQMVCKTCLPVPVTRCGVCGRQRPCHGTTTGSPRCVSCSRAARGTEVCCRCGKDRPVHRRDPGTGRAVCATCGCRRELCVRCGRLLRVAARPEAGPMCQPCWEQDPASIRPCAGCGHQRNLHHFGLCPTCALPGVLRQLLTGPNGHLHPAAATVLDTLLTTADPTALLRWAARPGPRHLLREIAATDAALTHELLDALPVGRHHERLRATLVHAQILPTRDEHLASVQRRIDAQLSRLTDPVEQGLLRRFVTWKYLARLRRQRFSTTVAQAQAVRSAVAIPVTFLTWLHERGHDLNTASQHDLNDWLALSPSQHYKAKAFLDWARTHGHATGIQILPVNAPRPLDVLPDPDTRWKMARRLLHDNTLPVGDRVAGLLVLLYGQRPARIVRLRTDHITITETATRLRLGSKTLDLPAPLDQLVRRQAEQRSSSTLLGRTRAHPWLFPGRSPDRPMIPHRLGTRLRELGVPAQASRNTALFDLAAQLDASVLSQLLGLSIITATRWTQLAGNTRPAYAAHLAATR